MARGQAQLTPLEFYNVPSFQILLLSAARQPYRQKNYLEDISCLQFKSPGFQLDSLSWLGLDGVDTLVVVVVVDRIVGGQQNTLGSSDR